MSQDKLNPGEHCNIRDYFMGKTKIKSNETTILINLRKYISPVPFDVGYIVSYPGFLVIE